MVAFFSAALGLGFAARFAPSRGGGLFVEAAFLGAGLLGEIRGVFRKNRAGMETLCFSEKIERIARNGVARAKARTHKT